MVNTGATAMLTNLKFFVALANRRSAADWGTGNEGWWPMFCSPRASLRARCGAVRCARQAHPLLAWRLGLSYLFPLKTVGKISQTDATLKMRVPVDGALVAPAQPSCSATSLASASSCAMSPHPASDAYLAICSTVRADAARRSDSGTSIGCIFQGSKTWPASAAHRLRKAAIRKSTLVDIPQ